MNRSGRQTTSFWFYAQIAFIVLPVICLSVVGGWLLHKDKLLAREDAIARATELAAHIAQRSWNAITNVPLPGLTDAWPTHTVFFTVNDNSQLTHPLPIEIRSEPSWWVELSSRTREVWAAAESAEFESQNLAAALDQWRKLLTDPELPAEAKPAITFHLATTLLRTGEQQNAAESLRQLAVATNHARLETGLPVGALAGLQLLTQAATKKVLSLTEARSILEASIESPSPVTDSIMRAARVWQPTECQDLIIKWDQHQRARAIGQRWLTANSASPPPNMMTFLGEDWFIMALPQSTNDLVARSVQQVIKPLLTVVLEEARVPRHFGVRISTRDNDIFGETSTARFSSASAGLIETIVTLEKPELLYAQQAARTRWFAILIAGSAIVALLGVVNTQRSFARERRLNELKSNFVSSVSHELRAPIASMRLMAESLQSGRVRDSQKQNEYYDYIVQECRRLSSLIENVLDFARIEQGRKEYDFQPVAPASLIEKAIAIIQPATIERGITITRQVGEALSEVRLDGNAICQALVNLLDNAIKHSAPGSSVELGVQLRDGNLVFWVEDSGEGIPAQEHERIFERFYRIGSELTRQTPGAGIGLSIVKHIVEAHRGRIELRSAPGEGSRFTIVLPVNL